MPFQAFLYQYIKYAYIPKFTITPHVIQFLSTITQTSSLGLNTISSPMAYTHNYIPYNCDIMIRSCHGPCRGRIAALVRTPTCTRSAISWPGAPAVSRYNILYRDQGWEMGSSPSNCLCKPFFFHSFFFLHFVPPIGRPKKKIYIYIYIYFIFK